MSLSTENIDSIEKDLNNITDPESCNRCFEVGEDDIVYEESTIHENRKPRFVVFREVDEDLKLNTDCLTQISGEDNKIKYVHLFRKGTEDIFYDNNMEISSLNIT